MLPGMSTIYPIPRGTRQSDVLTASANQTLFGPFDWILFDAEDVEVRTKVPSAGSFSKVSPADYAVVPVASLPGTFRIQFAIGLTAGTQVIVKGKRVAARSGNVTQGAVVRAIELEKELDKQAATQQELRRDVDSADRRAIAVPAGEEIPNLPPAVDRSGKMLAFGVDGAPIAVVPAHINAVAMGAMISGGADRQLLYNKNGKLDGVSVGIDIADFLASAESDDLRAALDKTTGEGAVVFADNPTISIVANGSTPRSLQNRFADLVNVKDFGAVGDGNTDDRAAIAAAAAAARGKKLLIPPQGNYLIDTDGGSIILEEVTLSGDGVLDGANTSLDRGANIFITGTTNSPFKVRRGTSINGLGFYYPNQGDSATPTAYPPTLAFDSTNGAVQFVEIKRNVVFNAYKFIEVAIGGNVGHVEIGDNYICALNCGIGIDHNYEHVRIYRNNFTFGFWLEATELGSRAYMRANATAVQIAQSDGVEFVDNLVFGHLNGVLLAAGGPCHMQKIALNKFDQVLFPIRATGAGRLNGVITGNSFAAFNSQDTTAQGRSIEITTSGAGRESINIFGNDFLLATEDHIYVSGSTTTRNIVVGPNNYLSWAAYKSSGAYGALNVNGSATNVAISGGWFQGGNVPSHSKGIMGSFNVLACIGAVFDGCTRALDVTLTHLTATGNTSFGTGDAVSNVVNAAVIWQAGNKWDKPSGASTKPSFLVRQSGAVNYGAGPTNVSWDVEVFDKGGNFSSPTFTAPMAGRYRFEWCMMHDNTGTAGDRWTIVLLTSSGSFRRSYKMIADYNSVSGEALVELAAGETATLVIQRVSGVGNFVTFNDAAHNYFSGSLIE